MRRRRESKGLVPLRPDANPLRPGANGPSRGNVDAAAVYAPALNAGFQAIASTTQAMHRAIAGKTFDLLSKMPGLAAPAAVVRGIHDSISDGAHAAVRQGGALMLGVAADAERIVDAAAREPGRKEQALRSALNGAFGDALAASGSSLATTMSLRDRRGPLSAEGIAALRPRVGVYLHGLGCDENSWQRQSDAWAASPFASLLGAGERIDYAALLEREFGIDAVHVRYNSGLPIEANARQLASMIEQMASAAPQVREWLLIGHSMGGLVARRAHAIASDDGLAWPLCAPMIVCLGSPHLGAPLEKAGHLVAAALSLSAVTRPLGAMADARSSGINDLRHGVPASGNRNAASPALRLVSATLGDSAGTPIDAMVRQGFGDGLVRTGSAAGDGLAGDVQRVELPRLSHMGLLNHPRVYAVIRKWLGAPAG